MKYAKLIDNQLVLAPRHYVQDGYQISNPTPEKLAELGYKPVTYTDPPEPLGVGWLIETWKETAETIVQNWDWHEATDKDEISNEEALQILLGGNIE